ncbi:MAG: formate dehydrogenase subunit delta [Pseudonocardiales bacterium]|nr:formate dehydrogenase subunit delta [Pseudonocardiales bacterium]
MAELAGVTGVTGAAGHSAAEPVLRLAGEIAAQFEGRPTTETAAVMADHIRPFWDPRRRRALLSAVDAGAVHDPAVLATAELIRR